MVIEKFCNLKNAKRLTLLAILCCFFTGIAAAKSWRVANFQDTITIDKDGSAVVTERISLVFEGEWHGIHRTIPIEYPGPSGTNYELFLDIKSVTDGAGSKLKYESSVAKGSRDLKIYIPDAVDTTRVVEIVYRVRNGTRFFRDYDEFYWNVTGNDWLVPIDHASATVRLPDSANGSLRAQAFTGVYGSTQRDATAKVNGAEAEFETNNPLPMRGGLTIDVYIPQGILSEPGPITKFFWFIAGNPIVFLPPVTFIGMFLLWWYKGRDPDPGVSVAPMYEPPQGISPAEAGTLLDDSIHPRDITSTIVDLAVRGYIKIEETAEKVLLFTHKDYVFHRVKPQTEWKDLAPHEFVMMEHIFGSGVDQMRLSSLKNRFYTAVPIIRQDIMAALKTKGIYTLDPESANGYSIGMVFVILIPFGLLPIFRLGKLSQFRAASDRLRSNLGSGLVAVRARYDGQNCKRRTDAHRGPRLPGVHESRGCGATQADAARTRSRSTSLLPWRWASSIIGPRHSTGS